MITLGDIEAARRRVEGRVRRTPCEPSPWLSEATGCRVHLKLENLQMTGSFKERGALNRLSLLGEAERRRGVVAASAGNHAQGVAYHAEQLGIACTIVMPRITPLVKVTATRRFGAEVMLHGDDYRAAHARAVEIAREQGSLLVHSFDDPIVVAGQGTIGLELLEQVPDLDAVVVAAGGGGLVGGVAVAVKERRPEVAVHAVEALAMPSLARALAAGAPVVVPAHRTIADGIAVAAVGALPLEIARRYVDGVTAVDESEIAEAILVLLEREKTLAEGAGAAPLAALLGRRLELPGKVVAVVIGGGNIDVNVLSRIIDRGLLKSGRLKRFTVLLPDIPGALARLLSVLADAEANVLQITHDRHRTMLELGQAAVELEVETRGFGHITDIEHALSSAGFTAT